MEGNAGSAENLTVGATGGKGWGSHFVVYKVL